MLSGNRNHLVSASSEKVREWFIFLEYYLEKENNYSKQRYGFGI